MAIDTPLKRASVQNYTDPGVLLPIPSGTIGQPERQMVGWLYAGILGGITPVFVMGDLGVIGIAVNRQSIGFNVNRTAQGDDNPRTVEGVDQNRQSIGFPVNRTVS